MCSIEITLVNVQQFCTTLVQVQFLFLFFFQLPHFCERLKTQNSISTELEADWQSWWSCKQLPLPINSCHEAALAGLVYSEL